MPALFRVAVTSNRLTSVYTQRIYYAQSFQVAEPYADAVHFPGANDVFVSSLLVSGTWGRLYV